MLKVSNEDDLYEPFKNGLLNTLDTLDMVRKILFLSPCPEVLRGQSRYCHVNLPKQPA